MYVLRSEDSSSLGPEQKGALRSLVAGRQWTQQRLHSAGLVESNLCQLCLGMPGGNQVGTLLHRCFCPALGEFIHQHMPCWMRAHLDTHGSDLSSQVHLAVTRGLFPALVLSSRAEEVFDTFIWEKQCLSIPCGCTVFTDGSLLDGSMPKQYQSLGWAFAVLSPEGVFIAAAYGTPPKWVDTIQGAELWAVQMALMHVAFPDRVLTDCDSVRIGVRKCRSWAQSSKRRYSRIWSAIALQLEDDAEIVEWMPAHTSKSSIGQVITSTGKYVTEDMWYANQIVDFLAKEGASSIRYGVEERSSFTFKEKQLRELAVFLGKLTYIANAFTLPDGSKVRDSEAVKSFRQRNTARLSFSAERLKFSKFSRLTPGGRVEPIWRISAKRPKRCHWGRGPGWSTSSVARVAANAKVSRAKQAIENRNEASFEAWWRESRSHALKPTAGPSARERLDALRQRLASRGAADGCAQ